MNSKREMSAPELPFMTVSEENVKAVPSMHFQVEDFEGPLDLLLHLIQRAEVNIYDIPVATITEQYLGYLSGAVKAARGREAQQIKETQRRLDDLTQFHVMAATLLQIKSRMLLPLPHTSDEPYEDPRRELVEQLLSYQKFKRLSEVLLDHQQERQWIITRNEPKTLLGIYSEFEVHDEQISPDQLLASFKDVVAAIGGEQLTSFYEEFTVKEKVALVHERLSLTSTFSFMDLVRGGSALEIICAFWAVLELAKAQQIAISQKQAFAKITVQRREMING